MAGLGEAASELPPEMLTQSSCCVCSTFGPCIFTHTLSICFWMERGPIQKEMLPSALLIGHFYYSSYLRQFLACCHLLAILGEEKIYWSKWTL